MADLRDTNVRFNREFMAEIPTSLDQLAEALGDEELKEYDPEDDDFVIVDAHDGQLADTCAMIQRMEINEDEVDMDSGSEDVAAGSTSRVRFQPVKEPLPSTEKYKLPRLGPDATDHGWQDLLQPTRETFLRHQMQYS